MVLRSSTIVEFQFFRGLPRLLFPSLGVQCRTCFGSRLVSIRCMCPNHLSRLFLRVSSILPIPVLFRTSSFVTMSLQVIPNILLSHLWCAASSFFMFAAVIDHVSAPYFNVESTNESYNLTFTFTFKLLFLQIFVSLPKVVFAFPSLVLISLSQLLSFVITLPR